MGRTLALAASLALFGCSGQSAPQPALVALGADVARVGTVRIPPPLVARVAAVRAIAPRLALHDLVDDALAAEGARARGLDRQPPVGWATDVTLARAAAERLRDDSAASGPPSLDELARLTVIHAVIERVPWLSRPLALAAADEMRQAVAGARDESEFERRAKKASAAVSARVERLPSFDASGQIDSGELDPTFVNAAFALRHPGDTSSVIETPFGWHVIRLVERSAPEALSALPDPDMLVRAVFRLRARSSVEAVLRARRQRLSVEVAAEAD